MTMNDELYQASLEAFTATRDALAARLKAAGDKDAAAEVKRARKPGVPAWAANQVVWHAAAEWKRLQSAAQALREKHEKGAGAEDLRQAGRDQREAVQACEARAAELLAQHGHAASPPVLQKVGHTLLALAHGAPGVTPGRLDHDLPAPGFEAFAGLTLTAAPPPSAPPADTTAGPVPASKPASKADARNAERARRRAALDAAEARHAETQRAVAKAQSRVAAEEERRNTLQRQLDTAARAHEEARRQLESAESEAAAAEAAWRALQAESAKAKD
jgi:hypothetical protein